METKVLIVPSAYKQGKVYSIIPENRSKDLKVKRKLSLEGYVAEVPELSKNLILTSEYFFNFWEVYPYQIIGDFNDTNLPLGLTTGVLYLEPDFGYEEFNSITYPPSFSFIASQNYTYSIYILKGDLRFFSMAISDITNTGDFVGVEFDLELNSYQSYLGPLENFNFVSALIESVGDDWFRLSFTFNTLITDFNFLQSLAILNYSSTGSGIDPNNYGFSFPFQGRNYTFGLSSPQLELGDIATSYAPVIDNGGLEVTPPYIGSASRINDEGVLEMIDLDVPKFVYNSGDCPSILVEKQRTNFMPKSNFFENYLKAGSVTINSNSAISPENINNATTIVFSTSISYIYSPIMNDSSGKIVSLWLRSPSGPKSITINKTTSTSGRVTLNLTEEWVRYEVYFGVTFNRFYLRPTVSNTIIEIYGVQVEKGVPGDKATSYIYSDNDIPLYSEHDNIMLEDLSGITTITEIFSDDSTKVIEVAQLSSPAVYYMSEGEIKLVKME